MKKVNPFFLVLAVIATISFLGIGIFIALESLIGVIASILLLVIIMGLGFSKKKKINAKETV